MASDKGNKGIIKKIPNEKLEKIINLLGVRGASKKMGISTQAMYKSIKKRGGASRMIYTFPLEKEG